MSSLLALRHEISLMEAMLAPGSLRPPSFCDVQRWRPPVLAWRTSKPPAADRAQARPNRWGRFAHLPQRVLKNKRVPKSQMKSGFFVRSKNK